MIDWILNGLRQLFGAPDVRIGDDKREAFYGGFYPTWQKQSRPTRSQSLDEVPNGYELPGTLPASDQPANFRGTVLSGTKRSWTPK